MLSSSPRRYTSRPISRAASRAISRAISSHASAAALLSLCALLSACEDDKPLAEPEPPRDQALDATVDHSSEPEPDPVNWTGCAQWTHDLSGDTLTTYPDDSLTQGDAETLTGLRLSLGERAWVEGYSDFVQQIASDLDTLDGWGTNAGIVMMMLMLTQMR